jgi:3-isopropylmalate dehydrogenase
MKARIAVLGGDGIGPEVIAEALRVLRAVAVQHQHEFVLEELPFGGVAIDQFGDGLPRIRRRAAWRHWRAEVGP